MRLTNKQQFVICAMVNADPTYIPEKETAEEKKYRESYLKTNPKGVAIAWVVVAVIISVYRYLTI